MSKGKLYYVLNNDVLIGNEVVHISKLGNKIPENWRDSWHRVAMPGRHRYAALDWLRSSLNDDAIDKGFIFYFKNANDALMFKLKFGGFD